MNIDCTKDVTISSEQEYRALMRSLRRAIGFNLLFVQCSPAEGERLIQRVEKDLPDKQIEVLSLKEPITNLYELVDALSGKNQIDVLFIQGLEHSLYDYEQSRIWQDPKERYSYSERGLPPLLGHLNLDREKFYDRFKFSFVFLVPLFALKYLIRRAPDFFDWRSGVFEFAMDSQQLQQESYQTILQGSHYIKKSSPLSRDEFRDKILKIQALIDEPNQTEQQKAGLFFEQARFLKISGDLEAALANYDRVIALQPNYPIAWCNRGMTLDALGHYEEAIASFDQALALESDNPQVWSLLGVSLLHLERYEQALSSFNQALALESDSPYVWTLQGVSLYKLGRYEEAIFSFDQVLALQPNALDAWHLKANCYALSGKADEAIESLGQAIALNPQFREEAKTDPDFNGIRDDERFRALVGDISPPVTSVSSDLTSLL